jgi:hypothetical protein
MYRKLETVDQAKGIVLSVKQMSKQYSSNMQLCIRLAQPPQLQRKSHIPH